MWLQRLCDALDTCYDHWHEKYTGKPKPKGLWEPWRTIATQAVVESKLARNLPLLVMPRSLLTDCV